MKTTDFINESFVEDAAAAHQDHEVQMARGDCYNAAKYAIELHKLLKNISEQQGLDGWVSEKITLANDYLRTVTEYLRYEQQSDSSGMDEFNPVSATQTLDAALGESAPTRKPAVVKTNKPIGSKVADIGPGGKEYNVKTDAEWDKQNKQKDVKEGMRGTVSFPDDEGTHTGNNPPVSLGGTFAKRPEVKQGSLVKASGLNGVWRVNDIRGDSANITQEIPNTSKSYSSIPVSDLRVWTNKPIKEQGHTKSDPLANRAEYAKRHGTGQVYKKTHAGDKTGMSQAYAYDIKRTGPKGVLPEENMSRAAKGHEKYGKAGMQALAKAGREGASEKELDTIRDKHDKYDESIDEAAKKGLYYYVNKRKQAGTSRDKDDPKAPSPQDWKNAAKTAKKESVEETASAGATGSAGVATTPGKATKGAGTLFGGEYQQRTPFTTKKKK